MRISEDKGFTLLELIVTIGVIGIIAAIAIPQFGTYKGKGFDRRAQISLRNVAIAEEAYFVDFFTYKDCNQGTCSSTLPGLGKLSQGVLLQVTSTASGFTGTSTHPNGTGQVFNWSS